MSRSATGGSTTATLLRDSWRRCSSSYAARQNTLRTIPNRRRRMICHSIVALTSGWQRLAASSPGSSRGMAGASTGVSPASLRLRAWALLRSGAIRRVPQINAGRLIPVLTDYIAQRRGHYICYLDRRHLPGRIRVFVDFVCSRIRARDLLIRP